MSDAATSQAGGGLDYEALAFRFLNYGLFAVLLFAGLATLGSEPGSDVSLREPIIFTIEIIIVYAAFRSGLNPAVILRSTPLFIRLALAATVLIAFSVAIFVAVAPTNSVSRTALIVLHGLFGLAVWHFFCGQEEQKLSQPATAIIVGLLGYIAFLLVYFLGFGKPGQVEWSAALPGFANIRHFGYIVMVGTCLAIGATAYAFNEKQRARYFFAFCAQTALWATLFWSGSRGSVIAIACAFIFSIFWLPFSGKRRLAGAVALGAILGAAISLPFDTGDHNFSLINRLFRTIDADDLDEMSAGRTVLWQDVSHEIRQRPWFGHGASDVVNIERTGTDNIVVQAHNAVLEYLLSWGFVGATCFFAVLAWLWVRVALLMRQCANAIPLLGFFTALNALLAQSLIDGTLYHLQPFMLVALCFGIALSYRPGDRTARPAANARDDLRKF